MYVYIYICVNRCTHTHTHTHTLTLTLTHTHTHTHTNTHTYTRKPRTHTYRIPPADKSRTCSQILRRQAIARRRLGIAPEEPFVLYYQFTTGNQIFNSQLQQQISIPNLLPIDMTRRHLLIAPEEPLYCIANSPLVQNLCISSLLLMSIARGSLCIFSNALYCA